VIIKCTYVQYQREIWDNLCIGGAEWLQTCTREKSVLPELEWEELNILFAEVREEDFLILERFRIPPLNDGDSEFS
jgi:hypothetical protein